MVQAPSPMARFLHTGGLLTLLCLLLAGCDKRTSNVEFGNANQHLFIGIGAAPEALDPQIVSGVTEHYVLLSLFEGLTTVHPETLAIEPGVARSWDVSEDGLRYTFHLDPEARWSNGDPVTAGDFLFSIERILSPALGAPYTYMLYSIRGAEAFNKGETEDFETVGVRAPDPRTLVIELERPTPYFLSLPTHFTWWPVHPPTILAHGSMTDRISKWTKPEHFVGNGPFALESRRLNHEILVRRNPHYRDRESVRLRAIHFLPVNVATEERAFRADQLHITSSVPIPRIEWYRTHAPEALRFDPYLGIYYYLINTSREPLDDPRVRKALAYAIDRDQLVEHVLQAGQQPAYHFTPPDTAGYTARARLPYDPEQARSLLAEAGFPGGEGFPELEILFNTSESHRTVAVAIQQMWKEELGIEIGLFNQEWKAYLATRREGSFDIARAAWIGDYVDPNTFLGLMEGDSGNNHTRWKDAAYDALIAKAANEPDQARRFDYFQQAEARLMEAMPVIPIYFYVRSALIKGSVRGWHPNILDYHPYQDVHLEAE